MRKKYTLNNASIQASHHDDSMILRVCNKHGGGVHCNSWPCIAVETSTKKHRSRHFGLMSFRPIQLNVDPTRRGHMACRFNANINVNKHA